MGVIQLLNKKDKVFNEEDEAFLRTFGTHGSVFVEIVQLQQSRIDPLEESKKELGRSDSAKSKALDYYLPTDHDLFPGKISQCPHCKTREDCLNFGGSAFCLSFTVIGS